MGLVRRCCRLRQSPFLETRIGLLATADMRSRSERVLDLQRVRARCVQLTFPDSKRTKHYVESGQTSTLFCWLFAAARPRKLWAVGRKK